MPWANRTSNRTPNIGSPSRDYDVNDYSRGVNTFVSNDKLSIQSGKENFLRLAQDARINTLGEYSTRQGMDFYSEAAGEALDDSETSTTGASEFDFTTTIRIAQPFTTTSAGRLTTIDVNLKNDNSATGTPLLELWTDDSSEPGTFVARTSIAQGDVAASLGYNTFRFVDAPDLDTATTYWLVLYVQTPVVNSYTVSTTTNSTDALTSTDSGVTWSSQSYSINFRQYYAPVGEVKGGIRARRSDGVQTTFFAQDTTLYSVSDVDGSLTAIKTGLDASATDYRFEVVNDVLYYVNGYDGYRKYDLNTSTESQVSPVDYTHIAEHKGLMFLVKEEDPNQVIFSNFADYETFTSTDFIYAPSPKTGDPVEALVSLNGFLFIYTRKNKYLLAGSDNATFQLEEAPDQKGTLTQETVTKDKNFMYYLSDDGVYRSNGTEAELISESIYQDILDLPAPETSCLIVNRGRLYLWFRETGSGVNNRCYVWNLNYGGGNDVVESVDTGAYVRRAFNGTFDDNRLYVGSSIVGQVSMQEDSSNQYTNLGGDINFLLQTHYLNFGSPFAKHEIRYWNPRFQTASTDYDINMEYAFDLRNNWTTYNETSVLGVGDTWGDGSLWGDGSIWGSTAEVQAQLYVPGEYRRIALRYKHYATRQPHNFVGHTLRVQTRRMR